MNGISRAYEGDLEEQKIIYHDLPREQELAQERADAAYIWLEQQPDRTLSALRQFRVRCAIKGCLLAEVYAAPLKNRGECFFVRSITRRVTHVGFLNWVYSDDWNGPRVWYPATCRHGEAKLEGVWLLDLMSLVRGWHHAMEAVEDAAVRYPEAERVGVRSRTFHPKSEAWRPR